MGHYRPRRPKLNEDPMKSVEILYGTVEKIKQGKFRGFSKWTPGIPTPEEHAKQRMGRLRALNHGVKPRLGVSVNEARNHSRYINAMVQRIESLKSSTARSKDSANVNMHPVLLRRPVAKKKRKKVEAEPIEQTPQKKKKTDKKWTDETVVDWGRTQSRDQPLKDLAPTQYPKARRKHRPGEVVTREDTPRCYTPKPHSKLIDGTHLCDLYHYNDSKSQKKYFSGADNDRVKADYKEVITNPHGLATLITNPWKPPPPPLPTYDPHWRIDMRLPDLPSDLKATSNRHTLYDPLRPSASRKPYYDLLLEPDVTEEEDRPGMPVASSTPRSAIAGKRIMRDSCTTPTRPGCSSSTHVHVADIKQKTGNSPREGQYKFGRILESRCSLQPPPLRTPPGDVTPESPISSTRPGSPVLSTLRFPVPTDYDRSDLEEGEIRAKYIPRDDPFWKWPVCCSAP